MLCAAPIAAMSAAIATMTLCACQASASDEPDTPIEEVTIYTSDSAEGACLAAVSERTGESDVAVLDSSPAAGATIVTVAAGLNRVRWRCITEGDLSIREIGVSDGSRRP